MTLEANNFKSIYFTIDDMSIHCYTAGTSGPPVVLLHGAGIDSALLSWGEIISSLSEDHQVFAPDLPGYGKSDKQSTITYSMDFYVDFFVKFFDKLGFQKINLIGLSLGGGISLRFSILHPAKVNKLVVVAPYGIFHKLKSHILSYIYVNTPLNELSYRLLKYRIFIRWTLLSGLIYDAQKLTDELLDEVYQSSLDPMSGKAFASFQRSELTLTGIHSDLTNDIKRIKAPTLLIQGTKDSYVPPIHAKRAHEAIPHSKISWFEKCRHWPQREQPEKFIQVVNRFFTTPI